MQHTGTDLKGKHRKLLPSTMLTAEIRSTSRKLENTSLRVVELKKKLKEREALFVALQQELTEVRARLCYSEEELEVLYRYLCIPLHPRYVIPVYNINFVRQIEFERVHPSQIVHGATCLEFIRHHPHLL
jgi:hypothetical protein